MYGPERARRSEGAPGLFVVLEGVEGSGKSTQAALLAEWLAAAGVPQLLTREPGGTTAGESIRRVLLHGDELGARAELLLILAARAVLVEEVIRPALAEGRVVVADRFDLSTLAYQGYGRGLPLDEVRRLNLFATGGLRPDLTLVLDVAWETGVARREREGRVSDRIERAGTEFHARVAEAYRLLAREEAGVERVDGEGSVAEVSERIRRVLRSRFAETIP